MAEETTETQPTEARPAPQSDTNKLLAALGYPFMIIALIMILTDPGKKDPFVKFHAWQALFLGLAYLLGFVIYWIPVVGWLLWLAAFVYIIYCAVQAYQEKYFEVPVIYGLAKKYIES